MSVSENGTERFGIGAVVARTGLTAQGIRMWEKRYDAVVPLRSETNRRLYSREDMARLVLMKQLTDAGHGIGRIANLGLEQLEARLAELVDGAADVSVQEVRETNRVLVIGAGLVEPLEGEEFEVLPSWVDLDSALKAEALPPADLLLVDAETLFPETRKQVLDLMQRSSACRALVVYRFASERDADAMFPKADQVSLLRGPVQGSRVRRECYLQLKLMQARSNGGPPLDANAIPGRLYDAGQLARLARINSAVNCECPRHLVELLKSLSAFEAYSEACEDRNAEDAMIHGYLHRTTAHARRSIEEALQHLLKAEGIELD